MSCRLNIQWPHFNSEKLMVLIVKSFHVSLEPIHVYIHTYKAIEFYYVLLLAVANATKS